MRLEKILSMLQHLLENKKSDFFSQKNCPRFFFSNPISFIIMEPLDLARARFSILRYLAIFLIFYGFIVQIFFILSLVMFKAAGTKLFAFFCGMTIGCDHFAIMILFLFAKGTLPNPLTMFVVWGFMDSILYVSSSILFYDPKIPLSVCLFATQALYSIPGVGVILIYL